MALHLIPVHYRGRNTPTLRWLYSWRPGSQQYISGVAISPNVAMESRKMLLTEMLFPIESAYDHLICGVSSALIVVAVPRRALVTV